MLPVRQDLVLYRGDSTDIAIRLFARGPDGTPEQLVPAKGEVFRLAILSPETGSYFNWSTAGAGDRKLLLEVNDDTVLRRRLTARESARLPLGRSLIWEFIRIPAQDQRRTYVTGHVTVIGPGESAPGDPTLNMTLGLGGAVLDITVVDGTANAAGLIAEAVAALRGDAPAAETIATVLDRVDTLAGEVDQKADNDDARIVGAVQVEELGPLLQFTADELNGTVDVLAKLTAWLAVPGPKRFPKLIVPGIFRLSGSLPDYPGLVVDWQRSTFLLMPPQDTDAQKNSTSVRVRIPTNGEYNNLTLKIPAGYRVRRPVAFQPGARARGFHVIAEDQIPSGDGDAGIIMNEDLAEVYDWSVTGFNIAILCRGTINCVMHQGRVERFMRGLLFAFTTGLRFTQSYFGAIANPDLLGQPGHNAVCNGEGSDGTLIWDLFTEQTGEHTIYLGDDGAAGGPKNFIVGNVRGRKIGQSFIKIRGGQDGVVHLSKGTDCSYGTTTTNNDDGIRLDRCKRVYARVDVRHSEQNPDNTFVKNSSCNYHLWLNACSDCTVHVSGDQCHSHSIVIGDAPDPSFPGSFPVERNRIILEVDRITGDAIHVQMTQGPANALDIELRGAPVILGNLIYYDAPAGTTVPHRFHGSYASFAGARVVDVQGTLVCEDRLRQVKPGLYVDWIESAARWLQVQPTRETIPFVRAVDGVMSAIGRYEAWGLFDFLHAFALASAGNAVLDLKSLLAANVAAPGGSVVFSRWRGYSGTAGGNGVISLPLTPTDGGTHAYTQDSAHLMYAVRSDILAGGPDLGTNSGVSASQTASADCRANGGTGNLGLFRGRINDATTLQFDNPAAPGLYLMQRSGTNRFVYKDGVQKYTDAVPSTGLVGGRLCALRNDTSRGQREIALVSAGAFIPDEVRLGTYPALATLLSLIPAR